MIHSFLIYVVYTAIASIRTIRANILGHISDAATSATHGSHGITLLAEVGDLVFGLHHGLFPLLGAGSDLASLLLETGHHLVVLVYVRKRDKWSQEDMLGTKIQE